MIYRTTVRVKYEDESDLAYLVQNKLENIEKDFKEVRVISIQENTEIRSYGDGVNYEKYIKVVIWYEGLSLEDVHKRSMNKMMKDIWNADTDTWEDLPL